MDVRSNDGGRSSDNLDAAADYQLELNETALENVQLRLRPQTHPDFDGENCLDCGDPLLENRLADKRMRCVGCQEFLEKTEKHYGH